MYEDTGFRSCFCNIQKASYVSGKRENEFIQKPEKAVETVGKRKEDAYEKVLIFQKNLVILIRNI